MKVMKMICNKRAYEDLKEQCNSCSEKEECINGKFVGVGYITPLTIPASDGLAAPVTVDNSVATIHVDSNFSFDVHKRDIIKEIEKQFDVSIDVLRSIFDYGM